MINYKVLTLALIMLLAFSTAALADSTQDTIFDRIEKAKNKSTKVRIDDTTKAAEKGTNNLYLLMKAYSLPILIVFFFSAVVLFMLSAIFGQSLKKLAGLFIFTGITGFILITYAPDILGKILNVINVIESIFS